MCQATLGAMRGEPSGADLDASQLVARRYKTHMWHLKGRSDQYIIDGGSSLADKRKMSSTVGRHAMLKRATSFRDE